MSFIKENILNVANDLNIFVNKILPEEFNSQRTYLEVKFCDKSKNSSFMWERLNNFYSIKDSNAWLWIDKILNDGSVIMFLDLDNEPLAFKLNSAKDVLSILSESIGFEFYLTNEKSDYLLCLNHHDYLIATGSIVESLKDFVAK